MISKDPDSSSGHEQREQTDESLRVERTNADAGIAEKVAALEEMADEVVRIARARADRVVEIARDAADRDHPQTKAEEAGAEHERNRADVQLERERSTADAMTEDERSERKRYLADFLAVERETTDQDLIGERAHTDTIIAARDEFLATVSHDLRSLLGGLSLNAELLDRDAPEGSTGDSMRRHAVTSRRLVARMNRLINDLLDVASIEAGMLAVVPEPVEISKLLRDTQEAFMSIAASKRISLEIDPSQTQLCVEVDTGRILQVLANLISNAVKFTPAEGIVSVRVRSDKNEIRFAVSDTGIGIPEDALKSVFERFRQVSRDRRGLGLGLHISKCIVEAHGGRMWVESKLAAGSTFYFSLPLKPSA